MTTEPPSTPYDANTSDAGGYSYQRPSTLATRALVSDPSSTDQRSLSDSQTPRATVASESSGQPLSSPATHRHEDPTDTPSPSGTPGTRSIHFDDPFPGSTRPPLPKRTSWNYESAVAERRPSSPSAGSGITAAIGGYFHTLARRHGSAGGTPGIPAGAEQEEGEGVDRRRSMDRKKSWAEQDLRREMMVNVMESPGTAADPGVKGMEWGYEST